MILPDPGKLNIQSEGAVGRRDRAQPSMPDWLSSYCFIFFFQQAAGKREERTMLQSQMWREMRRQDSHCLFPPWAEAQ